MPGTIDCGRVKLPRGGNPQLALDCTYKNGFPRVLAVDEAIFNQVPSSISLLTGLTQMYATVQPHLQPPFFRLLSSCAFPLCFREWAHRRAVPLC